MQNRKNDLVLKPSLIIKNFYQRMRLIQLGSLSSLAIIKKYSNRTKDILLFMHYCREES